KIDQGTAEALPSYEFLAYWRQRGHLEKFADAGVHHFSGVGHHSLANYFVLHVLLQLAIFHHIKKIVGEVAGVHLAGMIRNAAGEVDGADDGHAVLDDGLAGMSQLAVSSALRGEIDDDGTGSHSLHHVRRDEDWRFLAGDYRCGDDDVALGNHAGEKFALAGGGRFG